MLDYEHRLWSAGCWLFLKWYQLVSTRMDLKLSSRIKSMGGNVLMYLTASLFGTVISTNCESVKKTLPALKIDFCMLHGFSSLLYSPASKHWDFFVLRPSFSQHAKQVLLSVMSHFSVCVWAWLFNMSLRACLRVCTVHNDCLWLCWAGRLSDSHRLCTHALSKFLSDQRRK